MPMITITSVPDQQVIYEGEGDLDLGPSGGLGMGILGQATVLRQRVNGYQREVDLTGLLNGLLIGTRSQWCAEYAVPCISPLRPEEALRQPDSVRPLRSEDELRLPDPPRPVRWTLELDVPAEQAQWLREKLGELPPPEPEGGSLSRLAMPGFSEALRETMGRMRAGEPSLAQARASFQALTDAAAEAQQAVNRIGARAREDFETLDMTPGRLSATLRLYQHGVVSEDEVRRLHDEMMAPEPDTSGEYDDLIASTRAEFPPDPHEYGYPGDGPMHWTAPPEGEEVPSWP